MTSIDENNEENPGVPLLLLLLSRAALASLGMTYDIAKGLADFAVLGARQVSLIMSCSAIHKFLWLAPSQICFSGRSV